jgi:hypothetical protein
MPVCYVTMLTPEPIFPRAILLSLSSVTDRSQISRLTHLTRSGNVHPLQKLHASFIPSFHGKKKNPKQQRVIDILNFLHKRRRRDTTI